MVQKRLLLAFSDVDGALRHRLGRIAPLPDLEERRTVFEQLTRFDPPNTATLSEIEAAARGTAARPKATHSSRFEGIALVTAFLAYFGYVIAQNI